MKSSQANSAQSDSFHYGDMAAVPPRFQTEFPTELSLRPSQLKASAVYTVSMTPSAADSCCQVGELEMPIAIMAGAGDRLVDFARQSGRLREVLAESTFVPFEGTGHMIHHTSPEKLVDGINLAASRSGIAESNQVLSDPPPIGRHR